LIWAYFHHSTYDSPKPKYFPTVLHIIQIKLLKQCVSPYVAHYCWIRYLSPVYTCMPVFHIIYRPFSSKHWQINEKVAQYCIHMYGTYAYNIFRLYVYCESYVKKHAEIVTIYEYMYFHIRHTKKKSFL
jgi:hypothetical protein